MLSVRAQRWLKGLHILSAAVGIGGLVSLCVLMRVKYSLGDELDPLTVDIVLLNVMNMAVIYPFFASIVTGTLYSLLTEWGFIRHRWVTVKWAGAATLSIITVLWLVPAVNGMVALADGFFSIEGADPLYRNLFRQGVGAMAAGLSVLAILAFVSVLKPWGSRTGRSRFSPTTVRIVVGGLILAGAAFLTANAISLQRYRTMEIGHIDPASLGDGIYEGEAADSSFTYRVRVTVRDGMILSVKAATNRRSPYALYAEGVFVKVINLQSPGVDAITGATTTSKVLLKAVANAMQK
ncbi:MAG: FMN-binding protein [bacterium]|nr:MAG: FMN-binding protein [bacterium]